MPDAPQTIALADIDAADRLRPVDPDHAAFIAASIEQRGLLTPITVRASDDTRFGWRLVAGAHRLQALRDLKWTEAEVGKHILIVETDHLASRLDEIDENLCRHELNALDRAMFLAERRRVYEAMHKVHGKGGDRKTALLRQENIKLQTLHFDFSPSFTSEVSARVGLSERAVWLSLRIAEKLTPAMVHALRGTKVEKNQRELLALTDMADGDRAKAAAAIGTGEARSVAQAKIAIGMAEKLIPNDQTRITAQLTDCWRRADRGTRARFLDHIDAVLLSNEAVKQKRAAQAAIVANGPSLEDIEEALQAGRQERRAAAVTTAKKGK